jgi:hypothetical protein
MLSVVLLGVVMLGVVMLGVVMLGVVMLSVVMLGVVMMSVIMLGVVILGVVMLSVVAPKIHLNFDHNSPKSRSSMAALAPSTRIDFPSWKQFYKTIFFVIATNGQCYKTVYVCNLRMFELS